MPLEGASSVIETVAQLLSQQDGLGVWRGSPYLAK